MKNFFRTAASRHAAAIMTLFTFVLVACATSPTGRRQLMLLPDSQMNAMGADAFLQMKQEIPQSKDPRVNAYVKCVAKHVTDLAKDSTGVAQWEVTVFQEDSANAFALPGGKIGVHTGLLKVARTQGQLAAVLGHEVGHVIARHGNERVSEALAAQGGLALAGALSKESKHRGLLMAALGLGAQFGLLLPHSRTQESEADVIGLDLMAEAGFQPSESITLWKNMEAAGGGQPPEFLSTHPSHGTRTEGLQARMAHAIPLFEKARAAGRKPHCTPP